MYCQACGEDCPPNAAYCSRCGKRVSGEPLRAAPPQFQPGPTNIKPPLAYAIFVTVCCCMPFGIVAIVNASTANSKLAARDYEGARRAAETSRRWCNVSLFLGLIAWVLWGVISAATQ